MDNKIKNSENYINSILGKENGFSVPKNYFNTVDEVLQQKIIEEKLSKENSFNVPDSYFKNLEDSIISQVSTAKKETKVISLKDRMLKIIPIAAAASIVLFIGLNSYLFNQDKDLSLDSLTDNDIEYWLDSKILNTSDIAFVLEDVLLEENDFMFATIQDENIEEYINSIDDSSLFNELN